MIEAISISLIGLILLLAGSNLLVTSTTSALEIVIEIKKVKKTDNICL